MKLYYKKNLRLKIYLFREKKKEIKEFLYYISIVLFYNSFLF